MISDHGPMSNVVKIDLTDRVYLIVVDSLY